MREGFIILINNAVTHRDSEMRPERETGKTRIGKDEMEEIVFFCHIATRLHFHHFENAFWTVAVSVFEGDGWYTSSSVPDTTRRWRCTHSSVHTNVEYKEPQMQRIIPRKKGLIFVRFRRKKDKIFNLTNREEEMKSIKRKGEKRSFIPRNYITRVRAANITSIFVFL